MLSHLPFLILILGVRDSCPIKEAQVSIQAFFSLRLDLPKQKMAAGEYLHLDIQASLCTDG